MNKLIIQKNPNQEEFDKISQAVADNDGYCCCALTHEDDNHCMCKEFRESQDSGFCHCGRFFKVKPHYLIVLCGSTRFKDEFEIVNRELTLAGYIVLAPGYFGHSDTEQITDEAKRELDNLHKDKISIADAVFVINPGGYIGESTQSEIEFAQALHKEIHYLEEKE